MMFTARQDILGHGSQQRVAQHHTGEYQFRISTWLPVATSGDDNVVSGGDYRGRQRDFRRRLPGTTTWFPAVTSGDNNVVSGGDFRGQQRDFRRRLPGTTT